MSEKINIILGGLEEDLRRLRSAEQQVNDVITNNHELSMAVSGLMTNTESLISELESTTVGVVTQFSEKLGSLQDATQARLDEVANISKSAVGEQKAENLKALSEIRETNNDIKKLIGELINLQLESSLVSIKDGLVQADIKNEKHFKTLENLAMRQIEEQLKAIDGIKDGLEHARAKNDEQFGMLKFCCVAGLCGLTLNTIFLLILLFFR